MRRAAALGKDGAATARRLVTSRFSSVINPDIGAALAILSMTLTTVLVDQFVVGLEEDDLLAPPLHELGNSIPDASSPPESSSRLRNTLADCRAP